VAFTSIKPFNGGTHIGDYEAIKELQKSFEILAKWE
jgi:hypothetical protein